MAVRARGTPATHTACHRSARWRPRCAKLARVSLARHRRRRREGARRCSRDGRPDRPACASDSLRRFAGVGRGAPQFRRTARSSEPRGGSARDRPRNGNGRPGRGLPPFVRLGPTLAPDAFTAGYSTGALDMQFPSDLELSPRAGRSSAWQVAWARLRRSLRFSAPAHRAGAPRARAPQRCSRSGRRTAARAHGIRSGSCSAAPRYAIRLRMRVGTAFSPFADDPDDPLTQKLQRRGGREPRPCAERCSGPNSSRHPICSTISRAPPGSRRSSISGPGVEARDAPCKRRPPIVRHAPSRAQLKGSHHVDRVCQPLHDAGPHRRIAGSRVCPYARCPLTSRPLTSSSTRWRSAPTACSLSRRSRPGAS